jgi:hypothetical protein
MRRNTIIKALVISLSILLVIGTVTNICAAPAAVNGDVNGDKKLDGNDAIYLYKYHTVSTKVYPISSSHDIDYDENGKKDKDDALYLLYHTIFGDAKYPLNSTVSSEPEEDWSPDII